MSDSPARVTRSCTILSPGQPEALSTPFVQTGSAAGVDRVLGFGVQSRNRKLAGISEAWRKAHAPTSNGAPIGGISPRLALSKGTTLGCFLVATIVKSSPESRVKASCASRSPRARARVALVELELLVADGDEVSQDHLRVAQAGLDFLAVEADIDALARDAVDDRERALRVISGCRRAEPHDGERSESTADSQLPEPMHCGLLTYRRSQTPSCLGPSASMAVGWGEPRCHHPVLRTHPTGRRTAPGSPGQGTRPRSNRSLA